MRSPLLQIRVLTAGDVLGKRSETAGRQTLDPAATEGREVFRTKFSLPSTHSKTMFLSAKLRATGVPKERAADHGQRRNMRRRIQKEAQDPSSLHAFGCLPVLSPLSWRCVLPMSVQADCVVAQPNALRPRPRCFPSEACLANEVKTEVTDLYRSSCLEVLALLARCLYAHPAAFCSTFRCEAFQRKARLCRRGDAQRRACRPRHGWPAPTNSVMEHGASHGNSCLAGATFRHGFGAAVPRRN